MEERSLGEGDGNIRNRSIGSTFLRPSPSVPMPDEAAPRWDHRLILQAQLRLGGGPNTVPISWLKLPSMSRNRTDMNRIRPNQNYKLQIVSSIR